MVVLQDLVAALLLRLMVLGPGAPADEGLLVAPAGQREDPALALKALVADVVDETLTGSSSGLSIFAVSRYVLNSVVRGFTSKMTENMGAPPFAVGLDQTAAMQSISMSKPPFQAGTLMKIRAGQSFGKYLR